MICLADAVLWIRKSVLFSQLPLKKLTNPSNIFFQTVIQEGRSSKQSCKSRLYFCPPCQILRKAPLLENIFFFSTDSFDDTGIFVGVFCDPFCAFSVRLPGGSLGLFATRFAAVIWLETRSLVMFNTIKIAIARHSHGIWDLLQSPKVYKR